MAIRHSPPTSPSLPISCGLVRDRLTDHVLGALPEDEERDVTKHLEWCAGCRKELAELEEGVAAVGLALEPIAPPLELEQKVLARVSEAAGATARERRKFRIVTAIAVLATFFAVAALGYAAAVSGRLVRVQTETAQARALVQELNKVVQVLGPVHVVPAALSPVEGHTGGGRAIIVLSDDGADFVVVIAGGLIAEEGPYSASLVHGSGIEVPVGDMFAAREEQLSAYRFFTQDLTKFRSVVVMDRLGRVVLRGPIISSAG